MRSKSTLNPTSAQMIDRHVGRVQTLSLAIEQCKDDAKKAAMITERERRMNEIKAYKATLDAL